MNNIADKLAHLSGTKQAIRSAIEGKGVAVADGDTFRSFADKIRSISGGTTGSTDWLAFLEQALNDTQTASACRHIQLITDSRDSFSVTATNGNSDMVFYTSDGAVLPWVTGSGVSHTWDKSKDIPFDGLFKCRWIICCMTGPTGYPQTLDDALYSVVDGMTVTNNSIYKGKRLLRGIKFINGAGWRDTLTSMTYAMANGCVSLNLLDGMDFQYVTAAMTNSCFATSLTTLRNISGIKVSIDLKNNAMLGHDSLLCVLNALADVSGGTAQTLTLGTDLLGLLSNAEKAIATGKGWTLA